MTGKFVAIDEQTIGFKRKHIALHCASRTREREMVTSATLFARMATLNLSASVTERLLMCLIGVEAFGVITHSTASYLFTHEIAQLMDKLLHGQLVQFTQVVHRSVHY